MINLTRLLCDVPQPADSLRYGLGYGAPATAAARKPIVVWNITRRCNLLCAHCYSDSTARHYPGELTTAAKWKKAYESAKKANKLKFTE